MTRNNTVAGLLCTALAWCLAGCGGTYSPPRIQKQSYDVKVDGAKDKIYTVAKHAFRKSGLRFAFADKDEGRITTRPKTMKLTDRECDCGTAMGRMFASDERTTTDVSYFLIAQADGFSLRTIIEGQYIASDTSTVKRFHCVSRGALEKDMIERIKDALEESESSPETVTAQ